MKTVAKNVKQHSFEIDKIEELKEIATRYATVKDYVFSRYSGINSLPLLSKYKSEIRDRWTDKAAKSYNKANPNLPKKEGFAKQWGLPARYWKMALDEAISNIKTEWSNTQNRVRDAAIKNDNLTDDEKSFIRYVVRADDIFYSILVRKKYDRPESIADLKIREAYVHNLIRRYVRKYKGNIPFSKKKRSFEIDADMYKYKLSKDGLVLSITGLQTKRMIDIKVKDKNIHKGNLRIVIQDDNTVEVNRCKNVEVKKTYNENNEVILATDKGYTSLFATNTNREYGIKLGGMLSAETERLSTCNAKRNQIWAQIDKYEKLGDFEKANRIRLNNFGKIKYNRCKNKFAEIIKSYINHSILEMLNIENPSIVITGETKSI